MSFKIFRAHLDGTLNVLPFAGANKVKVFPGRSLHMLQLKSLVNLTLAVAYHDAMAPNLLELISCLFQVELYGCIESNDKCVHRYYLLCKDTGELAILQLITQNGELVTDGLLLLAPVHPVELDFELAAWLQQEKFKLESSSSCNEYIGKLDIHIHEEKYQRSVGVRNEWMYYLTLSTPDHPELTSWTEIWMGIQLIPFLVIVSKKN